MKNNNSLVSSSDFNYKPLLRDFIGYDDFFDSVFKDSMRFLQDPIAKSFPPYDIYTQEITDVSGSKNTHWFIRTALAGFSKESIKAKFKNGVLTIWNEKPKEETNELNRKYIYNGIASRQFRIEKTISHDLEYVRSYWEDGCLIVEFQAKKQTPEDEGYLMIE